MNIKSVIICYTHFTWIRGNESGVYRTVNVQKIPSYSRQLIDFFSDGERYSSTGRCGSVPFLLFPLFLKLNLRDGPSFGVYQQNNHAGTDRMRFKLIHQ